MVLGLKILGVLEFGSHLSTKIYGPGRRLEVFLDLLFVSRTISTYSTGRFDWIFWTLDHTAWQSP